MANSDSPRGLRLVGKLGGSLQDVSIHEYFIPSSDSTAVFVGDAVKYAGSSDASGVAASVAQAAASDALLGVVLDVDQIKGVAISSQNLSRKHRPASTAMYVRVCDDPNALYEIQDDSVGGALAAGDVGLNADIIVGSGSTTTGLSAMELDTSTKATTATLPLKIIGLMPRLDNEVAANAKVLVKINNHQHGSHTGTAGV